MTEAAARVSRPAWLAIAAATWSTGCGGGLPLLHPAHALGAGEVRASAGFSAQLAAGALGDAVRDATRETVIGSAPATADATFARGALVAASVSPGLAPFVGARAGLGDAFEGGLSYSGRAVRADVRRAFELGAHWALSAGAGGSAALYGRQPDDLLPGVDLSQLHGWGADVPVLIGYESDGDLYAVWLGARGGGEHVDVGPVRSVPGDDPLSLSATRFWAGGLLGVAAGFRHVHVAMELDAAYATISGDYRGTHAYVAGMTIAPAGCLWWHF